MSVSLSADSNTAIVGVPTDNNSAGAAWIWVRSGGIWTQQGAKLVGSGSSGVAEQGWSVSLSGDGNIALVGGPNDDPSHTGATWVWARAAGVWTQIGSKLVGSGSVGTALQGGAVALSTDGTTAAIGGMGDSTGSGAAWIFINPFADLGIGVTVAGTPPFPAGMNLSYTIQVVNNGPGAASNVVATDALPAGTTLVSATPSQGSCNGTTTVSCAIGAIANGGSASISLVVATSSTPSTISNTATVAALQTDPNPANNSSTSTINTIDPSLIPAISAWALMALVCTLAMFGASIRS